MSSVLKQYCPRTDFTSYEDFYENFRIATPEHFNFSYDVVDYYADNFPRKSALVWCTDKNDEAQFDFGQLRDEVNRTANFLKSQGIGKGDRVMLILKSRYEFWFFILALHKLGAIVIPATHMLLCKDLVYRIKQASTTMCVCTYGEQLLSEVDRAQQETGDILKTKVVVNGTRDGWIPYTEQIQNFSTVFPTPPKEEWPANDDIMLLYFTSGTSGFPKMVAHTFVYPLAHIITAVYWQNVIEDGLHYTEAETGWGKAVWGKLYGQWIAGTSVFVYEHDHFNALDMMQRVCRYGVTTFCAPPTIYRFLIKEDLSSLDFSHLKYFVTAGEALNETVFAVFKEKTGFDIHEAFGQTELVCTMANWPWFPPKPGSMGKPSPGYHLELQSPDGQPVELGESGELCVCTKDVLPPGIFKEYYLDSEKTTSVWHDGYYHTGDVAWKDADGFYWYVGRADDVIKSSGYRIGPFEVESVLMKHPSVLECAITGAPDPVRGQVVKATIVLAKGYAPSDELKKEIQLFVKSNTAPYKYPRIVEFVDSLPKTISGKIIRHAIAGR